MSVVTPALSPVDLFERAVYRPEGRDHRDAVAQLHRLLANLDKLGGDTESSERDRFHLRLAMAITRLMLDKSFEITLDEYRLLCASNQAIATVFACTPFQHADHIISQLADVSDIRNIRFPDINAAMKCLLCYSLYSRFDLNLQAFADKQPELVAPLVLAHLGVDLYSRPEIEQRMNRMLEQTWSVIAACTPDMPMVVTTSRAWMNCSYATSPDKHRIKQSLNSMIRNGIAARQLRLPDIGQNEQRERPVIIVPVELFGSQHAMYRCFARAIDRLREDFEVIGVSPHHCIDETACQIFDDIILFDVGKAIVDLQPLIDRIAAYRPDIVYYPSLGMANYTLLLANMRLASVQCFTLGHPASSFIDTIDYVIVQEQDFTTSDIYSETVVLTGNDTSPTINMIRDHIPEPMIRKMPETIEIAVTSKQMKINHRFLSICATIRNRADRSIRFRFFPGVTGYHYEFVRHEIHRVLPDAIVYPTTDYATYISNLAECDIRLGTFPFGGANTNMDCFGLGIPFVILDGEQPHSHSDSAQLLQADLDDFLVADDIDRYIDIAVRLIDDEAFRIDISECMLALDEHGFFNKQADDEDIVFHKTMRWIHDNHTRMKASDSRLWTLADQEH